MSQVNLQVQLLDPCAKLPVRATTGSAGYDLFSSADTVVQRGHFRGISTGIALAVPPGHYGRIAPRSGLAAKFGIGVNAGVIDEDYRGGIIVMIQNLGAADFEIKKGDRIAQLILERISTPEVEQVAELPSTVRGKHGFGSTGRDVLSAAHAGSPKER